MWLFFALTTTLLWGCAELFYKMGARQEEPFAHLKICVCVGAVMGVHALGTILFEGIDYQPINLLVYLPVSLCYILSMACSFFGMRFLEESISDPIENTSGALCSLLCLLFLPGASISLPSGIAILVILVGILGIGFLDRHGSTDRRKKIGRRLATVAFAMPFFYAVIDAVGSFLDAYYLDFEVTPLRGVNEENFETVANISYELTFAICALALFLFLKIKKVPFGFRSSGTKWLAAVCETAGQFTYVFAMSDRYAVISAPILSSVCVVSFLLSHLVLKERLKPLQYVFLAFIVLGILILAVLNPDA